MKKHIRVKVKIISIIAACIFGLAWFYFYAVLPIVCEYCVQTASAKINEIVNASALGIINETKDEEMFISKTASLDNISVYDINTSAIEKLSLKLCLDIQNSLYLSQNSRFTVNLGTISGIVLFSGAGPGMDITVLPISSVCHDYEVSAKAVGINQARYSIILNIITSLTIVIPGAPQQMELQNRILIADCIIVGKVPQITLGSTQSFDLLP